VSPPTQDNLVTMVAEMTGLTAMLAPGTVRRSLRDVGLDPTRVTARDMIRALPQMQARLCAFHSEHEAHERMRRIESFLTAAMIAAGEQGGAAGSDDHG
jgi:hypothetical protein